MLSVPLMDYCTISLWYNRWLQGAKFKYSLILARLSPDSRKTLAKLSPYSHQTLAILSPYSCQTLTRLLSDSRQINPEVHCSHHVIFKTMVACSNLPQPWRLKIKKIKVAEKVTWSRVSRKASQKAQKSIIFVQRYRFKTYHSCHFLVNFRHVQLFFGLNTFIFHQLYKKLNSQLSLIKTRLKLSLVFSNRLGYIEGNFGLAIYLC